MEQSSTIAVDPRDAAAIGMFSNRLPATLAGGPVLLCLDLGSKTGWALHDDGATVSGTMEFRPGRFEGGGMCYLRFCHWLGEVAAKTWKAALVAGGPDLTRCTSRRSGCTQAQMPRMCSGASWPR